MVNGTLSQLWSLKIRLTTFPELHKIGRSPDLEALKLGKGPSGYLHSCMQTVHGTHSQLAITGFNKVFFCFESPYYSAAFFSGLSFAIRRETAHIFIYPSEKARFSTQREN